MSTGSGSPHRARAPGLGAHPMCPQALTLGPEEDPIAGLVAVWLSIMLCGTERKTCHLGWGPGKIQCTGHVHLAGHLSCSSPADTPRTPALPQAEGAAPPRPALLQRQWVPSGWLGISQPCPTGISRCTGQGSEAGTSLPQHGPLGSVSCCSAHSVGRDGASPSPGKSPSQLEWDKGGRVTPAPCNMLKGGIPHGDITKSQESPQDLQPLTSLPPLWCLTGDTG